MSQATLDSTNAAILDLAEKLLKIANLQAGTALKEQQARYLPWQVWTAGAAAGVAVTGAAIALGHWL